MILARVPVWFWCWAAAVLSAVLLRPPLPVDETRYLAVAWEMWQRGDYIVPYLNGEPYHHKPPLLFWLMAGGWHITGVNDWWPRLVAPLFALATLIGTIRLARVLWPDDEATPVLAPLILVGAAFFAIFQTVTMFDMMLAACTVFGLASLVIAWRTGDIASWAWLGLAIGIGVLAKGPAILLHILPVALTAPWWAPALPGGPMTPYLSWKQWYARVGLATLMGAVIALLWAVPAGIMGGEEYRNMIFWGQSAGRIVDSFDHARPFWWYAATLPPLLLPWLLWPKLWRAVVGVGGPDGAEKLLIAWVLPAFLTFSMISGKQLHYLLPEFAAFALLFGRRLGLRFGLDAKAGSVTIAIYLAVLGAVLVAAPFATDLFREPRWFEDVQTWWALLVFPAAAACYWARSESLLTSVRVAAASSAVLVVVVHLAANPALARGWDFRPLAQELKSYEEQGRGIAHFGYYHGMFQFLGRLDNRVPPIGMTPTDAQEFIAANPDGVIVTYYYPHRLDQIPDDVTPLSIHRFRSLDVYVWPAEAVKRYPELPNRS